MTESVDTSMNDLVVGVICVDNFPSKSMKEHKEGKIEHGDENFEAYQKELKELKKKWEITIDVMMIIGKYFRTSKDYINVMRVCKKYHDLTQMYHFNPIPETSLFENMETQYLYDEKDKLKEGIKRHVYLYQVDYEVAKNKHDNDEYKRVELKVKNEKEN